MISMDTEIFEKILNENQHFQEMARIGAVGDYVISVFSDEGPIPHFHFFNTKTRAESCIKILECEYFKHTKYKATLNSTEKKQLQKFLETPDTMNVFKTNFEAICYEWNKNNPDCPQVPLDTQIPNYRHLN